ncbi:alpha/beta fold hydrolase [Hoeflea prorocentri]|uniref:Alpha/beta hydrolase n=1 Tax=Hoeflea prorocentri TaxID=1922333 RepID=A0A9X3UGH4_9HYPH|nr:alpha/beta hydrolase [Hoeflea prorocentri]MCY6380410.1 alpha/beta hydrolase [Hoeflea prorocentri]MDA5398210.1 alpha/beta hydrolase [Hoeflea prorocentri]
MSDLKHIDTSHARLAYRETDGPGQPLLMVHGNSTSHQVFRNQLDGAIGAAYRCVAFDLPGHGASDDACDPDTTYNVQGYAAAAVELMQALRIDRYAVLGWSLGGHIALDMMAQTRALAGVMITGSPPITQGKGAVSEGFAGDIEHSIASKQILTGEEIEAFAHNTCGPNAPYASFLKEAVTRCDGRARSLMIAKLACGVGPNQQELALNAPVPLAIVNGSEDAFIHNDFIARLPYRNLWDKKVHDLPGIGHAPFWEAPETFDAYLSRFLNDIT